MTLLPVYQLTVFEEDDTTPLFTVSTNPAHAQPYLKAPDNFPEQEVDFAKGSASIGQMNVRVVDVPQTPGDQTTGYLTGLLANVAGYSQINGHRALVTQDIGAGAETILDGVVKGVTLLDTFVTYELELRDIRERERKTRAFERTDTPTVLPRGVLNGYGGKLSKATVPLTADYRRIDATKGEIEFHLFANPRQVAECTLTPAMREALMHVAPLADEPEVYVYDRWKLLWRENGTADPYEVITRVANAHPSLSPFRPLFWEANGVIQGMEGINNYVDGGTLPASSMVIDLIIQYDGPVTEDWNLHIDEMTVGEFLKAGYDGDYSSNPPRIRYSSAAVLALTTPIRGRIKKPVDDFRDWAEKNAYPLGYAAPTLNADGEIEPVTYLLPPDGVTLPDLNDANCAPFEGAGWSHGTQDAINLVRVTYIREFRLPTDSPGVADSDRILEREVTVEHPIQASIDLLGEQVLELSPLLLRAIGTADGGPLNGDVVNEVGHQVAERVAYMATDRFGLGGQYFKLKGMRSDTDVEALVVGSWVTVSVSWMPDYNTLTRGLSRMAQVVGRRNLNAAWCSLTLVDAGSANVPMAAPTIGSLTSDAAGVITIPVNALGSGAAAEVQYAINAAGVATEPAADSRLWTHLIRVEATGDVTTPPVPAGRTIWTRARGEQVGRRPSAWTTADDITVDETPRVEDVRLVIDPETGEATLSWTPNDYCAGVLINYDVHDTGAAPGAGTDIELDADDLEYAIPGIIVAGATVTVTITPYDGWTGSAVSGTDGPLVQLTATGLLATLHTILVPAMLGAPSNHTNEWQLAGYVQPPNEGVPIAWALPVVLPDGVELRGWSMRANRGLTSDVAVADLFRVNNSGSPTNLSTLTHATTGWADVSDASLSEIIASPNTYVVELALDRDTGGTARCLYFTFTYARPNPGKAY